IYRIYPEDRFHTLIKEGCAAHQDDESIYHHVQRGLPGIKPFLADLTYALPSLAKQKREMARQTLELLGGRRDHKGSVETASTGRYVSERGGRLRLTGPLVLVNALAPTYSPVDIVERGGIGKLGAGAPLADYAPIPATAVADASVDLVTCYIGLHHIPPDKLG